MDTRYQLVTHFDKQFNTIDIFFNLPEHINQTTEYQECIEVVTKYQDLIYQKLDKNSNIAIDKLFDTEYKFPICVTNKKFIYVILLAKYVDLSIKTIPDIRVRKTVLGLFIDSYYMLDATINNIIIGIQSSDQMPMIVDLIKIVKKGRLILSHLTLAEDVLTYFGPIESLDITNCVSDREMFILKLDSHPVYFLTLTQIIYSQELEALIKNCNKLWLSKVHIDIPLRLDRFPKLTLLTLDTMLNIYDLLVSSNTLDYIEIKCQDRNPILIDDPFLDKFPNLSILKIYIQSRLIPYALIPFVTDIASTLWKNKLWNIELEHTSDYLEVVLRRSINK